TIAALMPLASVVLYYSTIPGALDTMYLSVIRWNLDLYAPLDNGWMPLFIELALRALLVLFAVYAILRRNAGGPFFARTPAREERFMYVVLLLSTLCVAFLMHKFFPYHFA